MRVWCSLRAARRPPQRLISVFSAPTPCGKVDHRARVTSMSSLPPSGARNASSETPKLRTWASDRHDVRFRFQCTQCGKCCTGRGGRVRINERELQRIAEATRESVERVKDKFLRPNTGGGGGEWLLRQSPDDAHCVFLDGNKCSIYQARPTQCRTYPWWPHHLISDYDWRVAAIECEGISIDSTADGAGDASSAGKPAYSFDAIAPQVIAHDIHRSGENYTHDEMMELLGDLLDADPSFVDEFKTEFFAKFSRVVVFQDEELAVLDTTLGGEEAQSTRCFVFKDRLQFIQSEVNMDRQNGEVDRSRLTLEVHRALCLPFVWLPRTNEHVRIALLGAGAATLPLFLLHHLPQVEHIDAIEPNARVVSIAHEFFGVRDFQQLHPGKLTLHEQMGEDFLQQKIQSGKGGYDLIVIDVDSGEMHEDVAAPPPGMLAREFLDNVKQQLVPSSGMAAFNVIALSPDALDRVQVRLKAAFPHGIVLKLEHTKNAVFFVFNSDNVDMEDRMSRLAPEQLARTPFQSDAAQTAELLTSGSFIVSQW